MKAYAEQQPSLDLTVCDGVSAYQSDRGLFTESYLRRQLLNSPHLPSSEAAKPVYERLRELWNQNAVALKKRKEAFTRSQFLDVVLQELGWFFIPEETLPAKTATLRKRPDYCLFTNREAQQSAAASESAEGVFSLAATVLEAKKAGHPLDQVSTTETPGWFPSQQAMHYLQNAKGAQGKRFFNWVILTNAEQWRLYGEHTAVGDTFSFHLVKNGFFCDLKSFRIFLALFRAAAFEQDGSGRCLLDRLREDALLHQVEIEKNLRYRVFDVLEELALAFYQNQANKLSEADLPRLYDVSMIFLYRLLFVLYAESRDLLPVKTSGEGANKLYRNKFSLTRFVDILRNAAAYDGDAFDELYEGLLKLFHLINGDRPEQNTACNVARYNGGLFNPDKHPEIESWRIGDKSLANILRQLIFAQPPARESNRQLKIFTDETIDYATMEVRQLGDIYEGLLGGKLVPDKGRLALKDENGKNHRSGVFYTPDWVVEYLLREALRPLLARIEASPEVAAARTARSMEKRECNAFALAVLKLNLVDPAMGSGHFLVRAVERLAREIFDHPTTRRMTEKVVTQGDRKRSKEEILRDGRIPVTGGNSQEEAEIAYWRRRIVEACIYGVDINPLAVELAKLSLWLTCIAADEPLSFLDHHLRQGNSLLYARVGELRSLPTATGSSVLELGDQLTATLRDVIAVTVDIEATASTEMELVKNKETRWHEVSAQVIPFVETAHDWVATLLGLPLDEYEYRNLALLRHAPDQLAADDLGKARELQQKLLPERTKLLAETTPFHWELAFPDVFFQPDGTPLPDADAGFDVVLGNPPYISTHTSMGDAARKAIEYRFGYLDDLYVHFTDLGFRLLRTGGTFGFIVSDTFFTLASKQRMRDLLQKNVLFRLGQCDPFDATVDAAIFVACKDAPPREGHPLLFVQARPRRLADNQMSRPDEALPLLPPAENLALPESADGTRHGEFQTLRLHQVPAALFADAHKGVFFEPRPATLELFRRFNEPVKRLVAEWWPKIETSAKFADNRAAIAAYHQTLKPGDVTLVGLIAEGGQGMRTANNARFLGYLDGTPQAEAILAKRRTWTARWQQSPTIGPRFLELLAKAGGDPTKPLEDSAAWENTVEPLREQFSAIELGFGKTDLYRVVPPGLVATEEDFQFTWDARREELFALWKKEPTLEAFWQGTRLPGGGKPLSELRKARKISTADFCALCEALQHWLAENKLSARLLGLRSGETYSDPEAAPRVAVTYNGFCGRRRFAPFRKGDPEGNRWLDNEPLYIDWLQSNVIWLFANSGRPETRSPVIRNAHLYFTEGVTYTLLGNHVALKAKLQHPCVFDASASRLTSVLSDVLPKAMLAIFNSDVFSYYLKKLQKNTAAFEISDLRMMPLVIPDATQSKRLRTLTETAVELKRLHFTNQEPGNEMAAFVRATLASGLLAAAPSYLRPGAQMQLLATVEDCLAVVELAVNWEAEKLYGVEGLGPFDEF